MKLSVTGAFDLEVALDVSPLPSQIFQVVFAWGVDILPATRARLRRVLVEHQRRTRRAVGPFVTPYVRYPAWSLTWCGPVAVGSNLHRHIERIVPRGQRHALRAFDVVTGRFRMVAVDPPAAETARAA